MVPTDHCRLVSIFRPKVRWRSEHVYIAYNRHLSVDVAFICSTLTHCGVCHLSVWRLKREVSYVHQSVWRWKWFFCQSNYVWQRLRLCRTSDTVFRREIDSRRQWGCGTCYGGIVSPLLRSVLHIMIRYFLKMPSRKNFVHMEGHIFMILLKVKTYVEETSLVCMLDKKNKNKKIKYTDCVHWHCPLQ